ncbi:MAG: sensor histidine kinase [Proteobacteria bacterium]|nr:sensor histidine kinase [Pseudomonadota bacterium]
MRVRTYGLLLLGLAGIAPQGIYGYLAVKQSQRASIKQVCESSEKVTGVIVDRFQAYARVELYVLETIGIATLQASERARALGVFELGRYYAQFEHPAVYELAGGELSRIAGTPRAGKEKHYAELARAATLGKHAGPHHTGLERAEGGDYVVTMAAPIKTAGEVIGAIVATYNTMGMWAPVNAGQIGKTGFAAVVAPHGELLAHGNPDRRRWVFDESGEGKRYYKRIIDESQSKNRNRAGDGGDETQCPVYDGMFTSVAVGSFFGGMDSGASASPASGSRIRGVDWYVMVEQSSSEALAESRSLITSLIFVGVGVLVFLVITGLLLGCVLVRALERLRVHARELGHNLDATIEPRSRLIEIRELAESLNEMAENLGKAQDEARKRERLTTFASVAAGLAHDLRVPIETVRGACDMANANPHDEQARVLLRKVAERHLPKLKRYVDDLRRLAQEGNLNLDYQPVNSASLMTDICVELSSTPKWQGVEFKCQGQAGTVTVDQNLIRRAVINLAGNGAEACLRKKNDQKAAERPADDESAPDRHDDRESCVIIELGESTENEFFEIRVIDSGPGIPPERLEILQNGDFQSTKRRTGVGLGLGVARQIADAHGGILIMSSNVGDGSRFTLRLPRDKRSVAGS